MAPSRAQPVRSLRARPSNGNGNHANDSTTSTTTANNKASPLSVKTPTSKKNIRNGSSKSKSSPIITPQTTTRGKRRYSEISKSNSRTPVNVSTKRRQPVTSNVGSIYPTMEHTSPRQKSNMKKKKIKSLQSRPQTIDDIRHDALIAKKQQLEQVLQQQDARVRQLFHLHKFVTLTSYDPQVASQDDSHVFEEFKESYDLWEAVARDKTGGNSRSTRRQINQQKLLLESLEKAAEKLSPITDASIIESSSSDSSSQGAESPDEEGKFNDIEFPPPRSDRPLPKHIKLKFSIPPLIVSHPSHVLESGPSKGSLDEYLSSFAYYGDSEDISIEEYQRRIDQEAILRRRINEARQSGRIFQDATGNLSGMSKAFVPPREEPAHLDHLASHAIQFAKLISDERKSHVSKAKRIAMMIQQHFRRLSTAGEKEKKMEIRRIRQLAKRTALEVKKKWRLAEKVVIQRQQAIKQEQRRRAGKLQLEQILEHSSMLLEARLQSRSTTPNGKVEDLDLATSPSSPTSTKTSASAITDTTGISENESLDLNMDSESDETSADELKEDEDVDRDLSIDALKAKYSKIEIESVDQTPEEGREKVEVGSPSNDDTSDSDVTMDSENEQESDLDSDDDDDLEGKNSGLLALFSDSLPTKASLDEKHDEEVDHPVQTNGVKHDVTSDQKSESISPRQQTSNDENGNLESEDESVLMDSEQEEEYESDSEIESQQGAPTLADLLKDDIADIETNGHLENRDNDDTSVKLEEDQHSESLEPESVSPKADETSPKVQIPFLLRGQLREYQRQGLEWLVGLYNNNTNGILADEMGLGKTIQTISLIAYLACFKSIWGPHLIIVPTSVMLNWEMEFKRFAPGLKILTYYGNPAQRKEKRRGWNKEDTWHVCITSYQLVLHDHVAFRRKHWHFMILDEAHNIKNFRSQRWQALLNFRADHRLLLTGTPLQNNLVELWSLLYFLMPSSRNSEQMPEFANLKNFQEWFSRPVDKIMEGEEMDNEAKVTVSKLHTVLRPYLLRRLKADVEKQMPGKYEHVVYCRLSKRQRYLYDDFMSRAQTRETLASGNFLSIINCLMQLRKVCNHPDLFEVRPIVTSFAMDRSVTSNFNPTEFLIRKKMADNLDEQINLDLLNLVPAKNSHLSTITTNDVLRLRDQLSIADEIQSLSDDIDWDMKPDYSSIDGHVAYRRNQSAIRLIEKKRHLAYLNKLRCERVPLYSRDFLHTCKVPDRLSTNDGKRTPLIRELAPPLPQQAVAMDEIIDRFGFVTPAVKALDMPRVSLGLDDEQEQSLRETYGLNDPLAKAETKLSIAFPDKRLLQYDCGKLQRLAELLRDLISQGHRALIFTQMTKVLDILEQFINIHGWRYLRLDGSTKIEQRQLLTERFNTDAKIPLFILSTRSGGLGINLTGADTVIFYDSDWNPSMDRQCQDRCHRIGQTRDVHIYRLVSEHTIESNILRKASQKTMLDNIVIQEGEFTTDYLSKLSLRDMLGDDANVAGITGADDRPLKDKSSVGNIEKALLQAEDADDAAAASSAMKEVAVDDEDFRETNADTNTRESSTGGDRDTSNNVSAANTPLSPPSRQSEGPPVSNAVKEIVRNELEDNDVEMEVGEEEEDGVGDVDDYMITYIERGYYY